MNVNVAELDERINKCQKILDADPESQIFAALADAYRKKGDYRKALEICTNGLEKHPDYGSAYIVLVKIFFDQGSYEEADRHLQKAITVGGRTRAVDILQSEILIKLGEKNKAKSILEKLLRSDPVNETVKNLLVLIEEAPNQKVPFEPESDSISVAPESDDLTHLSISTHKPDRRYTLSNALSIIKVLPRVLGVVAVTYDGVVIEAYVDGMISKEELGASAAGFFSSIMSGITKINLGELNEILVETSDSKLLIIGINKLLVVIRTRDDVNLGSLKLKISELIKATDFS